MRGQRPARRSSLSVSLLLALLAAGLYMWRGQPEALGPAPPPATISAAPVAASTTPDRAALERQVIDLVMRLRAQPDDPEGWLQLARGMRGLGQYPEAVQAYGRTRALWMGNAALRSEYAQALSKLADVLATRADGRLNGPPLTLISQALAIDPDSKVALALAATAATQRGAPDAAARYWRRLLGRLLPDSEDARWVAEQLGQAGGAAPASAPAPAARVRPAPAAF